MIPPPPIPSDGLPPGHVLSHWPQTGGRPVVVPEPGGLINRTWAVGDPPGFALQLVNPMFPAQVNERMGWVTRRLRERGLAAPVLLPTAEGRLTVPQPGGGCWRLLTWIPGRTCHKVRRPQQAESAGRLVALFHRALLGSEARLTPLRPGVHDTILHMGRLEQVLERCHGHGLGEQILELGAGILETWRRDIRGKVVSGLPIRPAHGDLKISNVRFDQDGRTAVSLIDLDTLGSMTLDAELGDALRSWCNRAETEADMPRLDLDFFRAALEGYLSTADFVTAEERLSLVPGMARISLELAARFCADAFHQDYFSWDPAIAPSHGEHNLLRARSQFLLAKEVLRQQRTLEQCLGRIRRGG